MDYPTYLIHYGVPGQKWGTRRWQYEDGSLTPDGYTHYGYGKKESTKQKIEYLGTRDRIKSGNLNAKDFITMNGSAMLHDLDAMYTNYGFKVLDENRSAIGSLKINELKENGEFNTIDDVMHISAADALKKNQPLNLDDELIMKSITRRINPNYGEKGTVDNCVRCTTALTLQKMGYSTPQGISAGRAMYGAPSSGFSYWFDGAEMKTVDTISEANDLLKGQKPGSFGEFAVSRYDADGTRIGGHSMAYSILNDGSIRIEDGQDGSIYKSIEDAMRDCGASEKQIMITRLDNTTPNIRHIAEDSMIDIGGKRTDKATYVQKNITHLTYDPDDGNRVKSYSWENNGLAVKYDSVGKAADGTLYLRDKNQDIYYDDNGEMRLNTLGTLGKSININSLVTRMENMADRGKTQKDIARELGLSMSTINKYLNGRY